MPDLKNTAPAKPVIPVPASTTQRKRSSSTTAKIGESAALSKKKEPSAEDAEEPSTERTGAEKPHDAVHAVISKPPVEPPKETPLKAKPGKSTQVLKVVQRKEGSEGVQHVLATLQTSDLGGVPTLGTVRTKLGPKISAEQDFCYPDGSSAEDKLALSTYFDHLDEEEELSAESEPKQPKVVHRMLFVLPPGPVEEKKEVKAKSSSVLQKDRFVVKISEWQVAPEGGEGTLISRGTLQSKTFGTTDASLLTLAGLRKHISAVTPMSSGSKVHKFCTTGGETVADEAMTFSDYIALQEVDVDESAAMPSVVAAYKLNSALNQPKVDLTTLPGGRDSVDVNLKENFMAGAKSAKSFTPQVRESEIVEKFKMDFGGNPVAVKSAGLLTESEWTAVLANCGVMYGWVIDREKNQIRRAPKAAFQLRPKVSEDPIKAIPDFLQLPSPKPTNLQPALAPPKRPQFLDAPETSKLVSRVPLGAGSNQANRVPESTISEVALLETTTDNTADENLPLGKETTPPPPVESTEPPTSETQLSNAAAGVEEPAPPPPGMSNQSVPLTTPSFRVNDDSRIEITMSSHEFETSMAKNDFSSQSTEGSLSGGYAGFTASISAGYASSKSNTNVTTNNTYQRTIIAKYLFPRADIFLHPDDLEPTPELKDAIAKITKFKNVKDLRKLQQDFGQLFCKQVTVGGRLQSTQILKATTSGTEQEQKEQFKVSVGVQVSTPIGVGAGMKHEQEKGSVNTQKSGSENKQESNVFEAVGGNTIVAADPVQWSASVADFNNWRVINREALSSMMDMLSAVPGYENVKNFFVQAVPTLSKYIELPPTREIKVRFQVAAPVTQLSLSYLQNVTNGQQAPPPIYYLGHIPGSTIEPRAFKLASFSRFWEEPEDLPGAENQLFTPSSYRAPVILGYSPDAVNENNGAQDTVWSITAPFNESLQHGARVSIRTSPTDQTARPSSLVVFRNRQGVFLPGMSDIEDTQYWRILKRGVTTAGENIQEGDPIRLCWSFADQTVGFRDFTADVFGRRRCQPPPGMEHAVLFPKLPWPRFESLKTPADGKAVPNAMVMSTETGEETKIVELPCRQAEKQAVNGAPYGIQDVCFRIDIVANDGKGDGDDYLLKDVRQTSTMSAAERMTLMIQQRQQMMYRMFFL